MVSAEVKEFVNNRLVPIESQVADMRRTVEQIGTFKEVVDELQLKIVAQDADLKAAEKRFEEIAILVKKLEDDEKMVFQEKQVVLIPKAVGPEVSSITRHFEIWTHMPGTM